MAGATPTSRNTAGAIAALVATIFVLPAVISALPPSLKGQYARAAAARLNVTAMSLYHHVRDKEDLLDGLVERLLVELPIPNDDIRGEERLYALANGMRGTAARHPQVYGLFVTRPLTTAAAVHVRDVVIHRAVRDAGVPDPLVPKVNRLLSNYFVGSAASEVGGRFTALDKSMRDAEFEWGWKQILMHVLRSVREEIATGD
jgi:AcrR family transcriptional regulator